MGKSIQPLFVVCKKAFCIALSLILILAPLSEAYDPEYLNEVVGRKAVSLGDGFELIMYLMHLEETYSTFESQMEFLKKSRWIPESLAGKPADTLLRRGELAYLLGKALGLKGGLKARILGWNERFAMEELIHQEIMRAGHPDDFVTGQELVVIMTRAVSHLAGRFKK
jgi:hypothetical protein